MSIENAAQALELKKLISTLADFSEEAEPQNWVKTHLEEFWQIVRIKEVKIFYQVNENSLLNSLAGREKPDIYALSLDQKNQTILSRRPGGIDHWMFSDKSHSPDDFFRKLKSVLMHQARYTILRDGEYQSKFTALLGDPQCFDHSPVEVEK